jgi:hypothetical protein
MQTVSAADPQPRAIVRRIPPYLQVLTIAGTFLSIQLLYGRMAGDTRLGWRTFSGLLTFALLFLQLRIIDDIDDHDGASAPTRAQLITGLVLTVTLTVALNADRPPALAIAGSATVVMLTAPRAVTYLRSPRPLVLAGYEAGPALIMAYGYAAWRGQGGQPLPGLAVTGVTGLFWISYEVWKWSREIDRGGTRPHGLGDDVLRAGLIALLAAATGCAVLVRVGTDLPPGLAAYLILAPVACAGWLTTRWRRPARPVGQLGLALAVALQVGVVLDAGVATAT